MNLALSTGTLLLHPIQPTPGQVLQCLGILADRLLDCKVAWPPHAYMALNCQSWQASTFCSA
jgi:hypothetical protein